MNGTSGLEVSVDDDVVVCRFGDDHWSLPVGADALTRLADLGDPPRPEELTNAIGLVVDHLDDLVRARPELIGVATTIRGETATAIAAVEVGAAPTLPMTLGRAVVEEVFRTLATERSTDRRRNPGLPGHLVESVVAGCCIAVAVMRRLHLDELVVVEETAP
jgi:exopolyphosphatase/pppGpp-phosphohydrolase